MHHEKKIDHPSGTAKKIINSIMNNNKFKKEIPVHSIRLSGVFSHHEVIFGGISETFTIKANTINNYYL